MIEYVTRRPLVEKAIRFTGNNGPELAEFMRVPVYFDDEMGGWAYEHPTMWKMLLEPNCWYTEYGFNGGMTDDMYQEVPASVVGYEITS